MTKEEMKPDDIPVIFTPDNEPYRGRRPLFVLDTLISAAMKERARTAPRTHGLDLTDHQIMASQVIPQALSLALSIRELIRQGYLFGGYVLLRPLVERVNILLYLHLHPDQIEIWNRGWEHREAPGLAKMFDAIQETWERESPVRGGALTKLMNSLVHGKPDSAPWSLVPLRGGRFGHAPSKALNRPDLCDDLCDELIPWLAVVPAMMAVYFPDDNDAGRVE
jgi:hypothetical protein